MVSNALNVGPYRKILRRNPKQDRSKDRIKNILTAAAELIGEKGIDAVTMKEIGARTGGPIASVYQYFPDKTAILTMLHDLRATEARRLMRTGLKDISTVDDVINAQAQITDKYYELMRSDANAVETLNAIKACKAVSQEDLTETRARVNEFFEATKQFVDPDTHDGYKSTLLLLSNMADASVRLAVLRTEAQGKEIMRQFKVIARAQIIFHLTGMFPATL